MDSRANEERRRNQKEEGRGKKKISWRQAELADSREATKEAAVTESQAASQIRVKGRVERMPVRQAGTHVVKERRHSEKRKKEEKRGVKLTSRWPTKRNGKTQGNPFEGKSSKFILQNSKHL